MSENPYAHLPAVSRLLAHPALRDFSVVPLTEAIRSVLDRERARLSTGQSPHSEADLLDFIREQFQCQSQPGYRTVINATGIVLHTNLGRAPMAESAAQAAYRAARGYLALEIDLESGERASRQNPLRAKLCKLTGAESATAVNNCAAATILALKAVASGKDVIVSRGQLIEIGGSFRLPDIMGVSGASLREVGTTNITRIGDYEAAISPNTAALLRVHCSNYRVRGFTKSVSLEDLVALGRKHSLPVIDDVGSGAMVPMGDEPCVPESVEAGADLVLFSGDKLLGGPQAGILVGKKYWIDALERDPLMRAFRLDKMTLAALEATLELYTDRPATSVPTLAMLAMSREELRSRCESFAVRLRDIRGLKFEVIDDVSFAGGGTLPDDARPTVVIAMTLEGIGEESFAESLRTGSHSVVARIQNGRVVIDLRTVFAEHEPDLVHSIAAIASRRAGASS